MTIVTTMTTMAMTTTTITTTITTTMIAMITLMIMAMATKAMTAQTWSSHLRDCLENAKRAMKDNMVVLMANFLLPVQSGKKRNVRILKSVNPI